MATGKGQKPLREDFEIERGDEGLEGRDVETDRRSRKEKSRREKPDAGPER